MRVLVVTAVVEEADAVLAGLAARAGATPPERRSVGPYPRAWETVTADGTTAVVLVGGVGIGPAAASTATALATADHPFDLVLDAGIAGGFAPHARTDSVVLADRVVAADHGAESDDPVHEGGFVSLDAMGFGVVEHALSPAVVGRAAELLRGASDHVVVGTVLTVNTVTGTAGSLARLTGRHPEAVAEAMEGFGVVSAALPHDVPVLELRTISNPVGVADREAWDLPGAFARLAAASGELLRAADRDLVTP